MIELELIKSYALIYNCTKRNSLHLNPVKIPTINRPGVSGAVIQTPL